MGVLRERGPSAAAKVRDALTVGLACNTILILLRRMEEKGYLGHEEEGRVHRYFPLVEGEEVRGSALRRLLDRVFLGSPELRLNHSVSERSLSQLQVRQLRRLLDDQLPEEDR